MAIPASPQLIPQPFGGSGVSPLPDTTEDVGRASWSTGFPQEVSGSIKGGGVPYNKDDMNGALNTLSQHAVFQQSGAVYEWSESLDYPVGAHVLAYVEEEGNQIQKEFIAKKESGPGVESAPVDPEQEPVYVGPKDPAEDATGEFWQNLTALLDRVKAGAGIGYGTSSTDGDVAAKEVEIQDFVLLVGTTVEVLFVNANTAENPTLNVSGTGDIPLQYQGVALPSGTINAGSVYQFVYDGANYQLVGGGSSSVEAATELPKAPGTASTGTSQKYAREDHVHPSQTVPSASNTTPSAPSSSGSAGTSSAYARADHSHPTGSVGGVPVGTVVYFSAASAPDGYLVCNGGSYSSTTYADLYAVIGTTFGGNSTNFKVPNLIDKVAWGNATVGTSKSAGLPNITGNAGYGDANAMKNAKVLDGAFVAGPTKSNVSGFSINATISVVSLNASSSNSIYGSSTTVQPPALTLLPCIKY